MRKPEGAGGSGLEASFCRFSNDDFQCDFQAYQTQAGFELHVAARRVVWEPPESPYDPHNLRLPQDDYARLNRQYHDALKAAPQEAIELEGAGQHHVFATLGDLRDAVQEHVGLGFRAPDWLLPSLQEEIEAGH